MSENTTAEISFEQAISELEKLVSEIENGSLLLYISEWQIILIGGNCRSLSCSA